MLNKKLIEQFAKKIDDLVDWVKITGKPVIGKIAELADNFALPWGLNYLNEKYGDKIPAKYVDEIEAAIQCFIDDDYQGILDNLPDAIDETFDIPFFEDDFEAVWIATNFQALLKTIKHYAQRKVA